MTALNHISIGWRWLATTLNRMIDGVNARTIIPSATVAVQETPGGVVLTVTKPSDDTAGGGPTGGAWMTVTIVDPNTCAQSQIQVWSRPVPS